MRRVIKIFSLVYVAMLLTGVASAGQPKRDSADFELGRAIEILSNMMYELDTKYVGRADVDKLLSSAAFGMSRATDPYSQYLSEKDMDEFDIMTTGKYGGIGSPIRKRGDNILFGQPYEGFPADEGGVKAGDKILMIDGVDVRSWSIDDVSKALRGDPETDVVVGVERSYDGRVENLKLRRRRISVPSVPYSGIIRDGVGYIAHNDFIQGSYDEVRKALEALMAEGELRGLVLDYRSNGGGLMREAVSIASLFVDHGERIVSIMGRDSSSLRHFATEYKPIARDIPIVILVNGSSASASEILAGSLQDMDRAVVMGQRTYGKGLVQSTAYLGYNTYLKFTTEKYYIPSGRCIQAHDYTSHNSDGTIAQVPDSLISEYTTRGGRRVYDGGGIVPDVKLEEQYISRFAVTLMALGYIENWCDEYMRRHRDDEVDVRTFKLSDEEYANFVEYISDKDVEYESESRRAFKALEQALEKELYDEALREELKHLSDLIKDDKMSNMQTYRRDIETMLCSELLSRYAYTRGTMEHYAVEDEEVQQAIDLILNQEEYRRILREQHLSKR